MSINPRVSRKMMEKVEEKVIGTSKIVLREWGGLRGKERFFYLDKKNEKALPYSNVSRGCCERSRRPRGKKKL